MLPIRKISPNEVSLNSYYGKCFVSTESRVSGSTSAWILKQVNKAAFEGSDWITNVKPGNSFNSYSDTAYIYGLLSTEYKEITTKELNLNFDDSINIRSKPPREDMRWCGMTLTSKNNIYVGKDNIFYTTLDNSIKPIGNIFDILKLEELSAPVRYSELALFRKNIPTGVILGYKLGWSKLLKFLQLNPRFVEPRKKLELHNNEYPITFLNGTYVFSKNNQLATLIMAGFMEFSKVTKNYDIKEFEHQDVYLNLLASKGLGSVYIREIDMLFDYFVDPITEEILLEMKEPTTFAGLLLKASELLLTYKHPKSQDGGFTRIRGYERFAGTVYKEFTTAIRQFRSKNISGRSKIDISPYKVWQSINEDPTKMLVPDINPIQDLKNDESVTYVGEGGRSSDAINKASRSFHVSDVGVISEGTVDSSDVGVNIYTSSDPNIKNHRGIKNKESEVKNTNRHGSAVLLAPFAIHDDQNRINFIQIQNSHGIQAAGYHPAYVRTGYESIIAQRVNPLFAYCAKENGKIISVTNKGVLVEYKSGQKIGLEVGRQFGRSEGSVFPFDIEPCVKEGQLVTKGDPIVYNTGYFEFDTWNPGKLVLKNSLAVKTVLWETKQTHEDACAISKELSSKLKTNVTYVRSFLVNFEQNLHDVAAIGKPVQPNSILMSIEDEITANLGSFGDSAIETLKSLSKQSPKSNYSGIVDRIEVFYHGDKDQMSPMLKKITDRSDQYISQQSKDTGRPKFTGQVTDDYRFEGTPLGFNKAEIRFYITVETNMGVADKVVFANQMKSINSQVMDYQLHTESGDKIDAVFSCRSIAARNVLSAYIVGTTTTLLKLIAKNAVKQYRE